MDDDNRMLERVAKQICDAILQPYKAPDAEAIERERQAALASLRADPSVVSAEPNPNDPEGIIAIFCSSKPVPFINLSVSGPSALERIGEE